MDTTGIIVLIVYVIGYFLSFFLTIKYCRNNKEYLTLSEFAWMSFMSLASWISAITLYIFTHEDKPVMRFKDKSIFTEKDDF